MILNYANDKKGESLASIVETFVRASHVNVIKNLVSPTGAYMGLHGSMYARIGKFKGLHQPWWR